MPPPPPPPAAPPPPVLKVDTEKKLSTKSNGLDLEAAMKQRGLAADHVYVRPPTPPTPPPDVLQDVITKWVDVGELYNQLQFGSNLIVVDVRSKELFDDMHVRSTISVPLEKIAGRSLVDAEADLPSRFKQRRSHALVVYDQDSVEGSDSLAAAFLRAMQEDRRARHTVLAVSGGLNAVLVRFPFLVKGHPAFGEEDDYHVEYPSMVLDDFMFLGAWNAAKNRIVLDNLGITHIVNATAVCDNLYKDDFKYIQCALDDAPGADIKQFFKPCLEFIEDCQKNKGRVLIHCQMGMSRSSTLVILWIMEKMGMCLRDATQLTRDKRPFINPNPGFLQQLGYHEEALHGSSTIRFPPGEPVTLRTVYEWRSPDGTWIPRVVVGYND
eukprot:m.361227 g.361227  ORF g.361227 m.361227 type:complete len:382 (-) comp20777_c0_seq1:1201-2346(-)